MPQTVETASFFNNTRFYGWIVTSCFTALIAFVFVVMPVVGIHRLGIAIGRELGRYAPHVPAKASKPAPEPVLNEAAPLALLSSGTGS